MPLLAHPVFADYMVEYGKAGPLVSPNGARSRCWPDSIGTRSNSGLIRTDAGLRAFGGAAFCPRKGETLYALESDMPNRIGFDLERVLLTEYRIDDFQQSYFVIDSFQQLFDETRKPFGPIYERLRGWEPYSADAVVEGDVVVWAWAGGLELWARLQCLFRILRYLEQTWWLDPIPIFRSCNLFQI